MANINLLPWREEAREKQKRDFIGILALVFLVTSLVVYLFLGFLEVVTDDQRERNAYLVSEITLLDTQIAEIRKITERKKDIERRTEIILNLQQSRNLPTHVLDELVRIVPPGIYLSSIEKKGSVLLIEGRSESNNNVANMMRKVKTSSYLNDPSMQSIVTQNEELRQLQRFKLRVTIRDDSQVTNVDPNQGARK
ncbi:PilN domain-containing protein [Shewanella frigidimarina]|jgi:type IV pilus assembly protein PilN|uniref:Fimbrial assembly family protein n=1 Tax=Shewanella frigidimarina (strain NCIMB 400) TaxID=318167 RepID=Q088T1_SHEFN|nr:MULTISPECIES: PilN domain-containing protein [Shewanella]MBB1382557.1 PilN domain-containing protein [Shewanella sp. SR41-2]ABI70234.1 Fimbrial assembly family protein [Shewanella frigidimarina NCIMB 400]MBB1426066.1 PilN domain-containing protein [Shewanella sp. SG44-2]PKI01124.1 fimbrial protein [Shewanella sp. 11B5]RPA31973.1 fimbrial protein [Shewanella frigidimarina]|tara:strand:- start:3849 stop:4433 length:585 start_codon:yes stop_codon:yes gene_type:complete